MENSVVSITERWRRHEKLPEEIESRLATLPELFASQGVRLAYLFGSLARGDNGNDVDVAILTDGDPAYLLRDDICEWLSTERVDVVDLRRASPVLRMEIVRTGDVLFATDGDVRLNFELETLRDYRDTAYMRDQQELLLRKRLDE